MYTAMHFSSLTLRSLVLVLVWYLWPFVDPVEHRHCHTPAQMTLNMTVQQEWSWIDDLVSNNHPRRLSRGRRYDPAVSVWRRNEIEALGNGCGSFCNRAPFEISATSTNDKASVRMLVYRVSRLVAKWVNEDEINPSIVFSDDSDITSRIIGVWRLVEKRWVDVIKIEMVERSCVQYPYIRALHSSHGHEKGLVGLGCGLWELRWKRDHVRLVKYDNVSRRRATSSIGIPCGVYSIWVGRVAEATITAFVRKNGCSVDKLYRSKRCQTDSVIAACLVYLDENRVTLTIGNRDHVDFAGLNVMTVNCVHPHHMLVNTERECSNPSGGNNVKGQPLFVERYFDYLERSLCRCAYIENLRG